MKITALLILFVLAITPYIWNAVKLTNCDFESDYRCEVIHGVGVFLPLASFLTVWFDDDED